MSDATVSEALVNLLPVRKLAVADNNFAGLIKEAPVKLYTNVIHPMRCCAEYDLLDYFSVDVQYVFSL